MNSAGLGLSLTLAIDPLACATCGNPATCVGRYEDMVDMEPACDECCGHGNEDGLCHRVETRDDDPGFDCSCGASEDHSEPSRGAMAHLVDHMNRYFGEDE